MIIKVITYYIKIKFYKMDFKIQICRNTLSKKLIKKLNEL